MWYDSARSKWRYLVEPSFATGGGLRTDSSQMPGEQASLPWPFDIASLSSPPLRSTDRLHSRAIHVQAGNDSAQGCTVLQWGVAAASACPHVLMMIWLGLGATTMLSHCVDLLRHDIASCVRDEWPKHLQES